MDLDHERVSFIFRIVFAKFVAILSSFDPSKGVIEGNYPLKDDSSSGLT